MRAPITKIKNNKINITIISIKINSKIQIQNIPIKNPQTKENSLNYKTKIKILIKTLISIPIIKAKSMIPTTI
jgi:hypothetical protein